MIKFSACLRCIRFAARSAGAGTTGSPCAKLLLDSLEPADEWPLPGEWHFRADLLDLFSLCQYSAAAMRYGPGWRVILLARGWKRVELAA